MHVNNNMISGRPIRQKGSVKLEQQEEPAKYKGNDTPQTSDPTVVYGKQLLTILFHPTEYSMGI